MLYEQLIGSGGGGLGTFSSLSFGFVFPQVENILSRRGTYLTGEASWFHHPSCRSPPFHCPPFRWKRTNIERVIACLRPTLSCESQVGKGTWCGWHRDKHFFSLQTAKATSHPDSPKVALLFRKETVSGIWKGWVLSSLKTQEQFVTAPSAHE